MEVSMPIVPKERQRFPGPIVMFGIGILVLAGVWVVGLQTGSFLVHLAYPLGFWLAADGLRGLSGTTPLYRRPLLVGEMILVGAFLGLLLDFHMVGLAGILDLAAVTTPALALAMYVGWGLALPAVYSSYRLVLEWIARGRSLPPAPLPNWLPLALVLVGLPLAVSALFFRLWVGQPPGWLVVPVFLGLWILAEHLLIRRGRPGLLGTLLAGDLRSLLAMVAASLPFTLLWEGLNAQMGSWFYRDLFWLEPRIAGISLVVFFGYACGYYALFLSAFAAVRAEGEQDLEIFTRGGPRRDAGGNTLPRQVRT